MNLTEYKNYTIVYMPFSGNTHILNFGAHVRTFTDESKCDGESIAKKHIDNLTKGE